MRHPCWPLLLVFGTMACGAIDRALEGVPPPPPPPAGQISLALLPATITAPQGGSHTLSLRVSRSGSVTAAVRISFGNLPSGVATTLGAPVTDGSVTTIPATLTLAEETPTGQYQVTVRGTVDGLAPTTASLLLTVAPKPEITLAIEPASVTVARGGIAPVTIELARTNFADPVDLALTGGPAGVALLEVAPVTGTFATRHLQVAAEAAIGAYTLRLVATADGSLVAEASLEVVVTSAALQLIAPATIRVPQSAVATRDLILNRTVPAAAVVLTVEGLPPETAAELTATGTHGALLTVTAGPGTVSGTYPLVLRAASPGAADATAPIALTVAPASIGATLTPAALTLPPGGNGVAGVTIQRTDYPGPVRLTLDAMPAGVTATPEPVLLSGEVAALAIAVAEGASPGVHSIILRAIPEGLLPAAAVTTTLALTISAPLPVLPVTLDWSACPAPPWVAAQDGEGAWVQLEESAGRFSFLMRAEGAGFAWVDGSTTRVRYFDRAEAGDGLVAMCPPFAGATTTMTGLAVHGSTIEPDWQHSFGGATAVSRPAAPAVTLAGVAPGTHDLVVSGFSSPLLSRRILLRRDVPAVPGGALGPVDISLPTESFTPIAATLQFLFHELEAGGILSLPMSYLTTAACTINPLWNMPQFLGVPPAWQRPTDFHMQTIRWTGPTMTVEASEVFHAMANRTMSFPPPVTVQISALPGGHHRLRAALPELPDFYNTRVTMHYTAPGARTMTVSVPAAWVQAQGGLQMPDLSGVAGWQASYGIPPGVTGSWWVTAEGRNGPGLCVEGRRLVSGTRRGSY